MKRAFEFIDEKSHKFWWIETSENKFVVNYGKIDTIGKYEIKEWDSVEECEKQAAKLINSKIRKGYKEVNFDYNNHYYFDDMEYDIDFLTSHPNFREHFTDEQLYCNCGDEETPFGSDTGNDVLHIIEEKIRKNKNFSFVDFPKYLLEKYKMTSLDFAIKNIHFPSGKRELELAINRLKFQELFTYSMKLLMLKKNLRTKNGIEFKLVDELRELKMALPYSLTEAQTRVVREILRDQKSPWPMNRLVQGDVGSGKTVVALIAMFNVVKNRYQATLMVPTEILANQHYLEAKKLLEPFNIHIELLTGSTPMKEKRRIKELISTDEPLIVIGTHALIQEDVDFKNLGLVITDEQHRFGVEQRSRLINKGRRPDVMVMTATPIPRTLALYVYSDLDISAIDQLPPGRKPIDTRFFNENERNSAYDLALDEIDKGRQVYIVCPLIEEDEDNKLNSVEKLYNELSHGMFRGIPIEILHGKMKPKEKDEIIERFKKNETKAIISTTVIEVGVNVPNASVMIIENAERFGLAQLHQLRGRVGRGSYESYCFLIAKAKSENTKKRMEIMISSTDGFYISEEDLKLRGSGEMFGRRQSGDEEFILANIYDDMNILRCAKSEAKLLLDSNEPEKVEFCKEIKNSLERWSKYICFN